MKNILVVHYSQSGQLTDILNNLLQPIEASDEIQITQFKIEMEKPYPFPWKRHEFFNVFPESFHQIPTLIKPIPKEISSQKYDLIILGYQVWFLTPSIPINSFLNLPDAKELLANTPVVTVIGCRNMWMMAQEKMKKKLLELKSNLVGNIVLTDRSPNHIGLITIAHWMFTGKKDRYLGIFPKPGVSQKDINESSKFGHTLLKHLSNNNYDTLQNDLLIQKAVTIKPFLITVDKRANLIFSKWAKFIKSKGDKDKNKRLFWVKIFDKYLIFAIWFIAPIVFILFLLTYLPLFGKIKKDIKYYSSVKVK